MSILKVEPQIANNSANFTFGNVFASNFYYANGALFSGGGSGTVKYTADSIPPSSNNNPGDQWYNTTTQILYEYINDGTGNYWVDILTPAVTTTPATAMSSGNSNVAFQPDGSLSISVLGTSNVVQISNITSSFSSDVSFSGNISVSGNIISQSITTPIGSNANLLIDPDGVGDLVVSPATEVFVKSNLAATSTTTGALVVSGGLGVAGNVYVGGLANANTLNVSNGATIAGNLVASNVTINSGLLVAGAFTMQQTYEVVVPTVPSGVTIYDYTIGGSYYHNSPSAAWTVNITNVPSTQNRILVVALIISQGATGYLPSAYQVNGSVVSVKWAQGSAPIASNSKTDILSISLMNIGGVWTAFGQSMNYS
jgi:hypothetical protein